MRSSGIKLGANELSESTDGGKGRTIDLVVSHAYAKTLLEGGDERNDRHRIELGNGTQQRRSGVPRARGIVETQDFVDHAQNLHLYVQL